MSCHACDLEKARCCRLRVGVTTEDLARLGHMADGLWGKPDLPGDFVAELPRRVDGRCLFLAADESCTVYDLRPHACRAQMTVACRGLR